MADHPEKLDEIIEYAIEKERAANALYLEAAGRAKQPSSRRMLTEMAESELAHAEALEALDPSKLPPMPAAPGEDLRIAEFLKDVDLGPDADFQTVLIYAMKREENSRDFYQTMADGQDDPKIKQLFALLSEQELGHKRALEKVYDDEILRWN